MQRILVVEDEMQIARTLRDYLEVAGFEVTVVGDGSAALASARGGRPDLVVLDLGLPGMDGLDVARELRRTSNIPIVMLTARGEESDRIVGLELGADDYLVKPFSPKELVARVRAVLRRVSGTTTGAEILRAGGIEVDLPKMRARVDGRAVELTPTEFQLLTTFVREPGRVFTRGQLLMDDLRTLSMVEAGVLPLYRETVDPRGVADDAVKTFRSMAEEAGVTLEAPRTDGAPTQLDADPVRVAEILANLVTNAVRHTPRGGRVTLRVLPAAGGVAFEVQDTGPGIPQDQLPIVFDRFVTSADAGGTGLGLAIAKRLVEAHGGTIEARSSAGEGTTIRLLIPSG